MEDAPLASSGSKAEKVSLTLQIDTEVYEAFLRKARQADMDVETFLGNTLTLVLGCRLFNDTYACSPKLLARKSKVSETA